uniref:Uncharacterized protein n=1 Tax=Desertifilum tharense IPPAS B-1220 TaxID=1781255 RepID=A0ACD5GMT5_9CYAN
MGKVRNTLAKIFSHPPIPPSPHLPTSPSSSHSELGTRNSELLSPHPPILFPLGTRNSELGTLSPHLPIPQFR